MVVRTRRLPVSEHPKSVPPLLRKRAHTGRQAPVAAEQFNVGPPWPPLVQQLVTKHLSFMEPVRSVLQHQERPKKAAEPIVVLPLPRMVLARLWERIVAPPRPCPSRLGELKPKAGLKSLVHHHQAQLGESVEIPTRPREWRSLPFITKVAPPAP